MKNRIACLAGCGRTAGAVALLLLMLVCSGVPSSAADASGSDSGENAPDSLIARAGRELEAGRPSAAEALYLKVLKIDDDDHRAEHGLAIVGLMREDAELAIKHARRAIKRDRGNSEYHLMLAYGYGMKASEGGFRAMFYGGKYKSECEKAVECDPENVDAHIGLLQYYAHAPGFAGGGMERAEATVRTIEDLDEFSGFRARAMVAMSQGDKEAAETAYLAGAQVDTTNIHGWRSLSRFYMREERYADAIPIGRRILRIDPEMERATYMLATAEFLLGDDIPAAEEGFLDLIARGEEIDTGTLASSHWRLGLVYAERGEHAKARAEWETALEIEPGHEGASEELNDLQPHRPE
jgi:tetratricopeptide (TPR) repeat protein